jgi:hypothetical protein
MNSVGNPGEKPVRFVESGGEVGGQLDVERAEVVAQLVDATCADDGENRRRTARGPGDRDLRWGDAEIVGDRTYCLGHGAVAFGSVALA